MDEPVSNLDDKFFDGSTFNQVTLKHSHKKMYLIVKHLPAIIKSKFVGHMPSNQSQFSI